MALLAFPPAVRRRVADRLAACRGRLRALFACAEVEGDLRLKIICGSLLFYFHLTFHDWWEEAAPLSTLGARLFLQAPAPLFEGWRGLAVMDLFATKSCLWALGMAALLGMATLAWVRSSLPALCILAVLFVGKAWFYVTDFRQFSNFHHFHLLFTLTFLIAHDKLRFFRGALALGYLLSGIVKLTPSWLFGEYFNALPDKLPLLPKTEWVVTAACAGVVVLELLGPLCWFTAIRWLRRLGFGAFVAFHLYSGVLVGFWYTTLMLPLLLAAFWGFREPLLRGVRWSWRSVPPLAFFALLLAGALHHYWIPGNVRLTGEGRYFGLFMFDANHSVRFEAVIRKGDRQWVVTVFRNWSSRPGEAPDDSRITCVHRRRGAPAETFHVWQPIVDDGEVLFNPAFFTAARMRIAGDPYLYYLFARELVRRHRPDQLSIRLEQRLDGHPETVTLLDIDDFGALDPRYDPLRHNEWILLPGPDSPAAYRWP